FVDGLVVDLRFAGPASGHVGEIVTVAGRQIPHGGLRAFDGEGARRAIADGGGAADDAVVGEDAVVQGDIDRVGDVFVEEVVAGDLGRDVAENEVGDAVVAGDFEGRLVVARAAPAGVLLGFEHLARVEAGEIAADGRSGEVVGAPQGSAPIEVAERAVGGDS